jgi:pyrroloquinoline quinone (PQQ) biosynthesis protein C
MALNKTGQVDGAESATALPDSADEEFFTRVEALRRQWNPLDHPFYRRWANGRLGGTALRIYASEEYGVVKAIDRLSRTVAEASHSPELVVHALAASRGPVLWLGFARAVGWGGAHAVYFGEDALPASRSCAELYEGRDQDPAAKLLTLYAIKSRQPAVNRARLAGLLAIDPEIESRATAYFRADSTRDRRHARTARQSLRAVLTRGEEPFLLGHLEAVCRSRWHMLDEIASYSDRAQVQADRSALCD